MKIFDENYNKIKINGNEVDVSKLSIEDLEKSVDFLEACEQKAYKEQNSLISGLINGGENYYGING